LTHLENHRDLKNIPQLYYRVNGQVVSNKKEYCIPLDILPSPYRLSRDLTSLPNRIQYIESSRGCPFKCSYCLASLEKNVRFFKIEQVKEEIQFLMNHGAKVFKFLDRTFNMRSEYALDMFQFIINKHQDGCVFQFEITGDLLDEQIIHFLNDFAPKHLIRFEIGVQSTNELTNKLILRKQDYQKLAKNIQLIQNGNKIDLHLDLIAGLPHEDYHSFIKTFNDVIILKPHELQLGFLKMLRGTKIRREAKLYDYHFESKAPYEIISHHMISKVELDKIHLAEEMLEKYYNSHRFDCTIQYILEQFNPNFYSFFEKLGLYWNLHYPPIHYQLYDLCLRLLEFYDQDLLPNREIIESLLIYDYLKQQKTKPKKWYPQTITRKERQLIFESIVSSKKIDINLDTLNRYSIVEKLIIHPFTYQLGTYHVVKLFLNDNQNIYLI